MQKLKCPFSAIKYGAEANFIFEKSVTSATDIEEAYGKLEVAVRKIPKYDIQGSTGVDYQDNANTDITDIRVRFYGDLLLPRHPTNFVEAVNVYRNISLMMTGPNAQSVPMKAYLYPMKKLDPSRTFALVQDIRTALIEDMVRVMGELEEFKEDAQDFVGSIAYVRFEVFRNKINQFLNLLQRYEQQFRVQVATLIPQIRGNDRNETDLVSILDEHFSSPFSRSNIQPWLRLCESESAVMKSFTQLLDPITFSANRGEHIVNTLTNDEVVSLNLYFPNTIDPFLQQLDRYTNGIALNGPITMGLSWFLNDSACQNILDNMQNILQFYEANTDSSIVFVYAVLPPNNPSQSWPSAEIKGFSSELNLRDETFTLPGPPRNIQENTEETGVILTWEAPEYESEFLDFYQIVITIRGYRADQESIVHTYRTPNRTFLIEDPGKTVPYDVYIFGVCHLGRTAWSEILHHSGVEIRLVGGAEICSPRRAHSGRVEVRICTLLREIRETLYRDIPIFSQCAYIGRKPYRSRGL